MIKKCNEIPTFYFDALKILDIYRNVVNEKSNKKNNNCISISLVLVNYQLGHFFGFRVRLMRSELFVDFF